MLNLKRLASLLASLLLLQTTAHAWGDAGHMVVAQIALESLSGTPAEKQAKINELNGLAGELVFRDLRYNFATSACWMDDIRDDDSHELLRDWHFVTLRFFDGISAPDRPMPAVNAASVIKASHDMLLDKDRDTRPRKAYYVAVLTHLVGDLHQPLHCSTRYTPSHPDGDLGGNSFRLAGGGNLHSFWDGAGGFFDAAPISRPLNSAGQARLRQHATDIIARFPRSSFQADLAERDPFRWAEASRQLALDIVYKDISEGQSPSAAYRQQARDLSPKRMALAGYRLAQILDEVVR